MNGFSMLFLKNAKYNQLLEHNDSDLHLALRYQALCMFLWLSLNILRDITAPAKWLYLQILYGRNVHQSVHSS